MKTMDVRIRPCTPDERLSHQSVGFHERMGFERVAHFHRCGLKFDRWHDTVRMEKIVE